MTKKILPILLFLCCLTQAKAVQPQADINKTIEMLRLELQIIQRNIRHDIAQLNLRRNDFWKRTTKLERECDIVTMVLFSQSEKSVFGMSQASHDTYYFIKNFRKQQRPFQQWQEKLKSYHTRINGLRDELERIHDDELVADTKANLEKAMLLCDAIDKEYANFAATIEPDVMRIDTISHRIDLLEKSNKQIIERVSNLIFVEGNNTFPYILSRLERRMEECIRDLSYHPYFGEYASAKLHSESDKIVTLRGIISLCSWALFIIVFSLCKWVSKKPKYHEKRLFWALLALYVPCIIGDMVVSACVSAPVNVIRSIQMGIEFQLLIVFLIVAQMIRNEKVKFVHLCATYLPIIFLTSISVSIILNLLPTSAIALVLPFIYTFFFILQIIGRLIKRKQMLAREKRFCFFSLLLMVICFTLTWTGWSIISLMFYIYGASLMCIITSFHAILDFLVMRYRAYRKHKLWNYTLRYAIYPLFLIFAVVGCAYWDAHILNVTLVLTRWLWTPFIEIPDICSMSVGEILFIIVVGICLNYAIKFTKVVLLTINKEYFSSGNAAVALSIGSFILWLMFTILVIVVLHINHSGIIAAVGGVSVGLGFAMRDTFENFFYGLTMMMGRARPGDIVDCDGMRGKVIEVGIISTSVLTEDGPVLALPNRQLFGRNFKNMTRNESKEIRHLIFDISDNNDMAKVRQIIFETAKGMPGVVNYDRHAVVIRYFSSGIVRIDYKCWMDSNKYLVAEPAVREAIFKAFHENGITMAEFRDELDARTSSFLMENNGYNTPAKKEAF
mgnify:FL=1